MRKIENEKKEKKSKLVWFIWIWGVMLFAMIIMFLARDGRYIGARTGSELPDGMVIGAGVKQGEMKKDEEITQTENTAGEKTQGYNGKSEMTVLINGLPVFETGDGEGNLNIENPIENILCMNVRITLNATDEVVYDSGLIPPGHYIDNDRLTANLGKGKYDATAHVTLTDPDNPLANFNSADFKLKITIMN